MTTNRGLLSLGCALLMLILAVPTLAQDAAMSQDLLQLLNVERTEAGFPPLVMDAALSTAAQWHAADMAQNDYFDYVASDGSDLGDRVRRAGYVPIALTAQIASGSGLNAQRALNLWLEDGGEREVFVRSTEYTEVGIGAATASTGTTYFAIILGRPTDCTVEMQNNLDVQLTLAQEMLDLVNEARRNAGLGALVLNAKLNSTARIYSDDMLRHGYPPNSAMSEPHVGSDGSRVSERAERTGYNWTAAGENILQRYDPSVTGAFDQWWNSEGHRENMMRPEFEEMGLWFTCEPSTGEFYFTQVFGASSDGPQPIYVDNPTRSQIQPQILPMAVSPTPAAVAEAVFDPNPDLVALVNDLRAQNGVGELTVSEALTTAAQRHSNDMAINGFMNSTGSDHSDAGRRMNESGYVWAEATQLLSSGRGLQAQTALNLWVENGSSADLLNWLYTEIGVGVATGADGVTYYTLLLASPQ